MSTNANLPAGFTITSINGQRCTQVPRSLTTFAGETSFASTTSETVAETTTSSTPPPETTTSSAQVQGNSPNVAISVISTSSAAPTTSIASTPEPEATTSTPAVAATTSIAPIETVTPVATSSTRTSETSTSASPASKGTTPTRSSSTIIPIAQSEVSAKPTSTGIANNGFGSQVSSSTTSITTTTASAHAEESSAVAGISSTPKLAAAPVVGGVFGGIALIGIIGLIIWFLRRRRRRDSLLTPLTTGTREQFYEIDRGSVGPTKRSTKWKATLGYQTEKIRDAASRLKDGVVGIGASLKSKVVGDRSDTPSVNLNRGNSQFFDGPIPQHSRNNSVLSNHTGHSTVKDRFKDWWERFTENLNFNWRLRRKERQSMDPFASARSMTEKQANINAPPDFSQLLGMDDRELQLQAERRRASLSPSFPNLGSLGLDFSNQTQTQVISDPFADSPNINTAQNKPWQPPNPSFKPGTNPFADPITQPARSIPKQQAYIADIRRSRGLSVDAPPNLPASTSNHNKTNSVAPTSRYPSSIAPSRDSYRDTIFSSTTRRGKGRSDPFDLERPELWKPKLQNPPMPAPRDSTRGLYPNPLRMSSLRGQALAGQDSQGAQPRVVSVQTPRIVSATGTYGSKYSSGVSSLDDWGEPGPDLGPGSSTGSVRANASSAGSSEQVYGQGSDGVIKGSLAEMSPTGSGEWDQRRQRDNVSPMSVESKASSKGGVGKAL